MHPTTVTGYACRADTVCPAHHNPRPHEECGAIFAGSEWDYAVHCNAHPNGQRCDAYIYTALTTHAVREMLTTLAAWPTGGPNQGHPAVMDAWAERLEGMFLGPIARMILARYWHARGGRRIA